METPITPRSMSNKSPKGLPEYASAAKPGNPAVQPPARQAAARQDYASIVLPYFFLIETPITPRSMSNKIPEEHLDHAWPFRIDSGWK